MPVVDAGDLRAFFADLKKLEQELKATSVEFVGRKALREKAEELGTRWFDEFLPRLRHANCASSDVLDGYRAGFTRLVDLGSSNNRRSSYLSTLGLITRRFRRELVLPLQTSSNVAETTQLDELLSDVESPEESEYLKEARECVRYGLLRGSAILGWCAAIDHIHHALERIGFAAFNSASSRMATQQKGRYRKFSQVQNVHSIGELRQVFDSTTLLILEGMQLIDSNQYTRLRSCFDLRNQCAHPGEAPVTEYNLVSFFSDINEIVFKNPTISS